MRIITFSRRTFLAGLALVAGTCGFNPATLAFDSSPTRPPTASGKELAAPEALAKAVTEAVNVEREQRGLTALAPNSRLTRLALAHSEDMRKRDYFDHVTPDGRTPTERATAAGIRCERKTSTTRWQGIGENLYAQPPYRHELRRVQNGKTTVSYEWFTPDEAARRIVDGWLTSRGHRENLLNQHFQSMGTGVVYDEAQKRFLITQVYC